MFSFSLALLGAANKKTQQYNSVIHTSHVEYVKGSLLLTLTEGNHPSYSPRRLNVMVLKGRNNTLNDLKIKNASTVFQNEIECARVQLSEVREVTGYVDSYYILGCISFACHQLIIPFSHPCFYLLYPYLNTGLQERLIICSICLIYTLSG